MKKLKQLFLNEKFIMSIILLNTVLIVLQGYDIVHPAVMTIDMLCTIIFLIEMLTKIRTFSFRKYWQSGWNRLDFVLVIVSLPSLVEPLISIDALNFSFLLVLRLFRTLRFFRLFHLFPNFTKLMKGFSVALKQTWAVLIGYFIFILAFALISCALYKSIVPVFFATPTDSLYSIFRLFTVEGWYEIPEAIASQVSPIAALVTRLYFIALLILGGIIGMSFVNSIFVEALAQDNNDDVKEQLKAIEEKLNKLLEPQNK